MKNIHPKTSVCTFTCATCESKFEIKTTIAAPTYGIDICSKCHPFYIGKTSGKSLRGKSEKLQAKFDAAKLAAANKAAKKEAPAKKTTNPRKSLDSL